MRRRRRRQSMRPYFLAAAGVLLALPAMVVIALLLLVNPASLREQIETASLQSFGRRLTIQGEITVASRLSPTLVATNITLANAPGGSRPDMIRAEEMIVELAPRALLLGRVVIARLVLLRADILLELDGNGDGNWRVDKAVLPTPGAVVPLRQSAPTRVTLQTLHVRDARLTWRDGRSGRSTVIGVKRLSATAATTDTPVSLGAEFTWGRQRVEMQAQTGPLSRLQEANAKQPWGLFATADVSGAKLSIAGSFTRPLEGKGYTLRVDGLVPDLSTLSWITPWGLPQFRNIVLSGRMVDQGGAFPDISAVRVDVGNTNLEKVAPGFSLDIFRIDMPRLSEPVQIEVSGTLAGGPLRLNATIGPPALLLPPTTSAGMTTAVGEKFGVDVAAQAAGATFVAKGEIASPLTQAGMDIGFAARMPDLALLSPLVGRALPALKGVEFGGHAVDLGAGYSDGFTLSGLSLASTAGNLAGDVKISLGERLGIQAVLDSTRMDGEALIAALSGPVGQKLAAGGQPSLVIPPLPNAPRRAGAVIPDTDLNFDGFEALDTDIRLTMAELRAGRAVFREIAAHMALNKGRLVVDQFTAQTQAGRVRLALDVDSRADPPALAVSASAPAIDLKQLLPLFALTTPISGTLDFDINLRGRGRTQHALAASLQGRAAAALVEGELDNELLGTTLGDVFQAGKLGSVPGGVGRTRLRCLAVRADAAQGVITVAPFLMDSPALLVNAAGTLNLDDETASLQIRPFPRNSAAGVSPVRIGGGFRNLQFQADPASLAVSGPSARGAVWFGERGGEACGPALAVVRAPAASGVLPALPVPPPRRATP